MDGNSVAVWPPVYLFLNPLLILFVFRRCRWLKFEEDVEDGGERWSKPYVATLSLHSLFELRSCILNGIVMLDMRANLLEEIAGVVNHYNNTSIIQYNNTILTMGGGGNPRDKSY